MYVSSYLCLRTKRFTYETPGERRESKNDSREIYTIFFSSAQFHGDIPLRVEINGFYLSRSYFFVFCLRDYYENYLLKRQ